MSQQKYKTKEAQFLSGLFEDFGNKYSGSPISALVTALNSLLKIIDVDSKFRGAVSSTLDRIKEEWNKEANINGD